GPPPAPEEATPAPRVERRPIWLPVTTAATGAALIASLLTASLTGAFTPTEVAANDMSAPAATAPLTHNANVEGVDWQQVAATVRPAVVAITARTQTGGGEGSGVIINEDGYIVTNDHVVSGAKQLSVTLSDGRILPASVLGTDPTTDLAVVTLDDPPSDLTVAKFASDEEPQVGDPVMAVGNPLGLDSTVTTGIISALDRPVTTTGEGTDPFTRPDPVVTNAIQIDAAINPGNSGGPLFNTAGEVIGINSSIAALAGGSSGSIGLGFAIPAPVVKNVSDQLMDDGSVDHARLGVTLSSTSVEVDGVTRRGAKIEQVAKNSAAERAELQSGDVITAFDGKAVGGAESLTGFVRAQTVGATVKVTIVRDGAAKEISVELASSNPEI
ncbi:MAG TPA: trypsin-like peptidase domain-containing protein, partial [Actinomycetales bacterium]|nr:trypsin-like peptidase domain-containing protein [Actinomycetales bacterium]